VTDSLPPRREDLAATVTGAGGRVVLVHGFTQTGRSFARLATQLSARHEVVTVDLPGHGASGDVAAADLVETARLLGATGGRASYIGYSLGGRVCLTLALAQPELVTALVLVGTTPGIAEEDERAARRAADVALAARLDPPQGSGGLSTEEFLALWLAQPLFAGLDAEGADVASRRANTPAGLAASLRAAGTGTQRPRQAELAGLTMPVLCVAGENDEKFATIARQMVDLIGPNATLALIADAGHAAPFQQPEAFFRVVSSFLDDEP
jgi:2-succinyl-6-hydroxy-2,4-cyclohexadiene-1-carboxylate synthase